MVKLSGGFTQRTLVLDFNRWKISRNCSLLISQSTKISNSEFLLLDFRDSMCNRFTCFSCGKQRVKLREHHKGQQSWRRRPLLPLQTKSQLPQQPKGENVFSDSNSKIIPPKYEVLYSKIQKSLRNLSHPPETNNAHQKCSDCQTWLSFKGKYHVSEIKRSFWKFSPIRSVSVVLMLAL